MKKLIFMATLLIAKNSFAANVDTIDYPTGTLTVKTWYCDLINDQNKLSQTTDNNRIIYSILDVSLTHTTFKNLNIKLNQRSLFANDDGKLFLNNIQIAQVDPDLITQKMKAACDDSKIMAQTQRYGHASIASFTMNLDFSTPVSLHMGNSNDKCETEKYEASIPGLIVASATSSDMQSCFNNAVLKIGDLQSILNNNERVKYDSPRNFGPGVYLADPFNSSGSRISPTGQRLYPSRLFSF